jgi:hypothetical protein
MGSIVPSWPMKVCFGGPLVLSLMRGFGKPGRQKMHFFLVASIKNKCWTADHLARRGLDHPEKCHLCDQDGETIEHLMITCVFARQFWFSFLQHVELQEIAP